MPPVTPAFWVAVVLTTPVGPALAEYLDGRLGFGLGYVTALVGGLAVVAVAAQIAVRRYQPAAYWPALVATAAVAGLVSADLTEVLGLVPVLAAVVLALALLGTLAGDHVVHAHHEDVQWVAVLLALAAGTAVAGVVPVQVAVVALVALLVLRPHDRGPGFWLALALTRPVGMWLDGLTTHRLGTAGTTLLHLALVAALAAWSSTGRPPVSAQWERDPERRSA